MAAPPSTSLTIHTIPNFHDYNYIAEYRSYRESSANTNFLKPEEMMGELNNKYTNHSAFSRDVCLLIVKV